MTRSKGKSKNIGVMKKMENKKNASMLLLPPPLPPPPPLPSNSLPTTVTPPSSFSSALQPQSTLLLPPPPPILSSLAFTESVVHKSSVVTSCETTHVFEVKQRSFIEEMQLKYVNCDQSETFCSSSFSTIEPENVTAERLGNARCCNLCNVTITSTKMALEHIRGQKHRRALDEEQPKRIQLLDSYEEARMTEVQPRLLEEPSRRLEEPPHRLEEPPRRFEEPPRWFEEPPRRLEEPPRRFEEPRMETGRSIGSNGNSVWEEQCRFREEERQKRIEEERRRWLLKEGRFTAPSSHETKAKAEAETETTGNIGDLRAFIQDVTRKRMEEECKNMMKSWKRYTIEKEYLDEAVEKRPNQTESWNKSIEALKGMDDRERNQNYTVSISRMDQRFERARSKVFGERGRHEEEEERERKLEERRMKHLIEMKRRAEEEEQERQKQVEEQRMKHLMDIKMRVEEEDLRRKMEQELRRRSTMTPKQLEEERKRQQEEWKKKEEAEQKAFDEKCRLLEEKKKEEERNVMEERVKADNERKKQVREYRAKQCEIAKKRRMEEEERKILEVKRQKREEDQRKWEEERRRVEERQKALDEELNVAAAAEERARASAVQNPEADWRRKKERQRIEEERRKNEEERRRNDEERKRICRERMREDTGGVLPDLNPQGKKRCLINVIEDRNGEQKRREAAEEERKKREAAEKERKRREDAEKERKRREDAEKEKKRREAAEEERKRKEDAEKERKRREAAEEERKRKEDAEKERKRREAAEEERKRREDAEKEKKRREDAEKERKRREDAEEERKRREDAEEKEQLEAAKLEMERNLSSKAPVDAEKLTSLKRQAERMWNEMEEERVKKKMRFAEEVKKKGLTSLSKKQVKDFEKVEKAIAKGDSKAEDEAKLLRLRYCPLCETDICSLVVARTHLQGRRHKEQVVRRKIAQREEAKRRNLAEHGAEAEKATSNSVGKSEPATPVKGKSDNPTVLDEFDGEEEEVEVEIIPPELVLLDESVNEDVYKKSMQDQVKKIMSKGRCQLCNVQIIAAVSARAHLEGKRHQSNLARTGQESLRPSHPSSPPSGSGNARHSSVEKQMEEIVAAGRCHLCDVMILAVPQSARAHMKGKRHQRNLAKIGQQPEPEPETYRFVSPTEAAFNEAMKEEANKLIALRRCSLCKAKIKSLDSARMHLQGKKHHANLLRAGQDHLRPAANPGTALRIVPPPGAFMPGSGVLFRPKVRHLLSAGGCWVCHIVLKTPSAAAVHLTTKTHKRAIHNLQTNSLALEKLKPIEKEKDQSSFDQQVARLLKEKACSLCEVQIHSETAALYHLISQKHQTGLNNRGAMPLPAEDARNVIGAKHLHAEMPAAPRKKDNTVAFPPPSSEAFQACAFPDLPTGDNKGGGGGANPNNSEANSAMAKPSQSEGLKPSQLTDPKPVESAEPKSTQSVEPKLPAQPAGPKPSQSAEPKPPQSAGPKPQSAEPKPPQSTGPKPQSVEPKPPQSAGPKPQSAGPKPQSVGPKLPAEPAGPKSPQSAGPKPPQSARPKPGGLMIPKLPPLQSRLKPPARPVDSKPQSTDPKSPIKAADPKLQSEDPESLAKVEDPKHQSADPKSPSKAVDPKPQPADAKSSAKETDPKPGNLKVPKLTPLQSEPKPPARSVDSEPPARSVNSEPPARSVDSEPPARSVNSEPPARPVDAEPCVINQASDPRVEDRSFAKRPSPALESSQEPPKPKAVEQPRILEKPVPVVGLPVPSNTAALCPVKVGAPKLRLTSATAQEKL